MKRAFLLVALFFSFQLNAEPDALFAFVTLKTSMGDIKLKLYKKDAPRTVENFLGLTLGTKAFRDPKTGKKIKDLPFYKDMIFHKVHPDLGIQTGCPWGNGKGWPGYTLKSEENELKFDKPYLVAMSRIQDSMNSVGSQFFISVKPLPHLNGEHTIFGEVVTGTNIVDQISNARRDAMMKPLKPILLKEVVVESP